MDPAELPRVNGNVRGRLATADDVLELLPIKKGTLYALVREGRLPGVVKIGRRVYFDLDQLTYWVERGGDLSTA